MRLLTSSVLKGALSLGSRYRAKPWYTFLALARLEEVCLGSARLHERKHGFDVCTRGDWINVSAGQEGQLYFGTVWSSWARCDCALRAALPGSDNHPPQLDENLTCLSLHLPV